MALLTARQRQVLHALCDTFIPPSGEGGAALYARVEGLIELVEDPKARGQLLLLLTVLGNPVVNAVLGGTMKSVPAMTAEQRVALLMRMGSSAIQLNRAGFQAVKRLIHVAHYAWPTDGTSHPAWRDRKSTRLNSSHIQKSRMPSSA